MIVWLIVAIWVLACTAALLIARRIKRREARRLAEVRRQAMDKMQAFRRSGSERTELMDLSEMWRPTK